MRGNGGLFLLLGVIALAVAFLVGNDILNDGESIAGLEEDQLGDLAFMGVWVLLVASGLVFSFRGNLTGALKSAAIWATGFVVLVGLYAYRGEFQELGDRIMAELVPGHAIAIAGSGGREFMVMRAGDDHFHVEAKVNGAALSFLVDTGASMVALDRRAAESIGVDTDGLSYTARVSTANGIARAAMITLDEVEIGTIVRRNVDAAVMDNEGDGTSLLGMSFLGTLSSFDFRGERLILTD